MQEAWLSSLLGNSEARDQAIRPDRNHMGNWGSVWGADLAGRQMAKLSCMAAYLAKLSLMCSFFRHRGFELVLKWAKRVVLLSPICTHLSYCSSVAWYLRPSKWIHMKYSYDRFLLWHIKDSQHYYLEIQGLLKWNWAPCRFWFGI